MDFKKFIKGALEIPDKEDKIEYFTVKSRVSSNVLMNSTRNTCPASYHYEADITKFWEEFKKLREEADYHLTFNTLMLRVLAECLKENPRLNAHMKYSHFSSAGKLIIKKHIDVAMPLALENGETFPMKVREIEGKSLKEIAQQVDHLFELLKNTDVDEVVFDMIAQRVVGYTLKGKLLQTAAQMITGYFTKYKVATFKGLFHRPPDDDEHLYVRDFTEGTVCMSNWSLLGKDFQGNVGFTPLLYPQVFLMAVGNIRDVDYAFRNDKGEVDLATKKMLPIILVFDHRLGGFNDLAPFIKKLNEIFDNPEIIREW